MAIDPGRVKTLFQAAIERDDPAERRAFLDREVGDDPALRGRLDALLAEHDRPPGVLDRPLDADLHATTNIPGATGDFAPRQADLDEPARKARNGQGSTLLDTVIAERYKLRQEIGEGGMGSVYLAEQLQPVKRMVALKLIKAGMDTRNVLARFESERQALALMDHPHIARVLDAGSTEQGRPYFVMELVKGIPITEYCDRHHLSLPDRLAIFRQVCSAVQHAHQKGIIHRDLKPTNILVEAHDDKPVPKVIDFGLAKATSGMKLTDQSLFTAFGSVTGTPLYMAPEQASFNALDVDTRADIYALGVILYELLTGSTPIRKDTIQRAALDEMLRVIREDEPPTPSSRISTSDALPSLAAARHIEPSRLSRFVKGDLDWIVMKALAKERNRRYDSAIGLANDVERFINHEPVTAGPPTAAYRLRKFVRRNRGQVVAASLVLLALVAGIVGTTLGLFEARKQQRLAVAEARLKEQAREDEAAQRKIAVAEANEKEKARQAEAEQRKKAEESARQAKEEAAKALAINEFLTQDLLTQAEPANNAAEDKVTLLEVLDRAAGKVGERFEGQPEVALALRETIGWTYHGLGAWEKAEAQWRAVLEAERKANPESVVRYRAQNELSHILYHRGRNDAETLAMAREAADGLARLLGPDHTNTLASMNNLAIAYKAAGRLDRAIPLHEQTLELRKSKLGADHPDTLVSMNNLAVAYQDAGRLDRAIPLLEQTLELRKSKLGADHPDTLTSMNNLATAYQAAGRLDRAIPLLEQTLELRKSKLGADHPDTLVSMNSLAVAYQTAGRLDRAIPLLEQTLELRKSKLGADHPDTLLSMNNLATAYQAAGRLDRAIPLHEQTLELRKSKLGADHPNTLASMNNLATAYQAAGRLDRAIPLHEQTLELMKSKLGADHPDTLASMVNLATAYQAAGRLDRASTLLRELADLHGGKSGKDSPQYAGALATLGLNLLQQKRWDEAEPRLRECLAIRQAKEPDDWRTFNTRSLLGGALLGQKKYDEAEPLLRVGYEGMKQRTDKIPSGAEKYTIAALDRLIELAEATGKPDEAKAWRDEKARLAPPTPKPEPEKK
jgi:lipopolysaccharide biosynthesis regulator YciM